MLKTLIIHLLFTAIFWQVASLTVCLHFAAVARRLCARVLAIHLFLLLIGFSHPHRDFLTACPTTKDAPDHLRAKGHCWPPSASSSRYRQTLCKSFLRDPVDLTQPPTSKTPPRRPHQPPLQPRTVASGFRLPPKTWGHEERTSTSCGDDLLDYDLLDLPGWYKKIPLNTLGEVLFNPRPEMSPQEYK